MDLSTYHEPLVFVLTPVYVIFTYKRGIKKYSIHALSLRRAMVDLPLRASSQVCLQPKFIPSMNSQAPQSVNMV